MSRKSHKEIRRSFYEAGNIRCPICLERFTEAEALDGRTVTLEHVPPKALGGKPMCLTCTSCNVGAGHGVDQAAVLLNRPPKATVKIMGQEETIHLSDDPTNRLLGTITSPRHRPEDFSDWLKTKPTITLTVRTPITRVRCGELAQVGLPVCRLIVGADGGLPLCGEQIARGGASADTAAALESHSQFFVSLSGLIAGFRHHVGAVAPALLVCEDARLSCRLAAWRG